MTKKTGRLEFRLKEIDETRIYLLYEMKHNDLMSKKCKRACRKLNCLCSLFISAGPGCVSISAFVSLVGILIGITSSAVGLKMCAINAGIKKYQEKTNKHDKKVLLGKAKLDTIEVLISKVLIDLFISNEEFVSVKKCYKNIMRWKKK